MKNEWYEDKHKLQVDPKTEKIVWVEDGVIKYYTIRPKGEKSIKKLIALFSENYYTGDWTGIIECTSGIVKNGEDVELTDFTFEVK